MCELVDWWGEDCLLTTGKNHYKENIRYTMALIEPMGVGGIEDDLNLAEMVRQSGVPNVYGLQIQLHSNWNFALLDSLVTSTSDREVVSFLRYGWPLNRELNIPTTLTFRNHAGALQYESAVDDYMGKELRYGALCGPLCTIPSRERMAISPMTTRSKKNSDRRRIISDLSWPPGASVNDGIPRHTYVGQIFKIKYPTVDTLCKRAVKLVRKHGPGKIQGYKVDMRRAFRQISTCPRDWTLLGSYWKGAIFLDKVTVMGSRTGPLACQRVTNMIRHIMADCGYEVSNFVDDFMGLEKLEEVWEAYSTLCRLLRDLGVSEAEDKAVPPTYIIEFLGILFNLLTMTMSIPEEKIMDIKEELALWSMRSLCSRKQLERLIGKLQFAGSCIRPGRIFVSRLLNELRTMDGPGLFPVGEEMKKDVMWWKTFLEDYNGVSMLWLEDWNPQHGWMASDACLTGIGGVVENECFRTRLSEELIQDPEWGIVHYEMLAVIVLIQVFDQKLKGRKIFLHCDNEAVVSVVNTGKSRDSNLQSCLRWLWYLLAVNDCMIKLLPVSSEDNKIADNLSRSHISPAHTSTCNTMIKELKLTECKIEQDSMVKLHNW